MPEPILTFSMRLWTGDEALARWLAKLSAEFSRTDVIRAICYVASGLDIRSELRPIVARFDGLYVSAPQQPRANGQTVLKVEMDGRAIGQEMGRAFREEIAGAAAAPFDQPPRPNWPQ